jgi:hypothetical protein
MKRKMLLFTLALPVIFCQNVRAQTSSRLVAKADLANNGAGFTPTDSTNYTYSGSRGGDLNHTLKYDNATTWDFLGDTSYINAWYYVQAFDANNNITSIISQYWSGTGWVNATNNIYTYDSSNNVIKIIQQTWGGSSWVPVSEDVYSYVGSKLVADQYEVWNGLTASFTSSSEKEYYYDPVTGYKTNETDISLVSGPVNQTEYNYTYSGTGQLLTTTYSTWNGAMWNPSTMYSNTFDTTGNLINTLFQTYDSVSASWVNSTLNSYSSFVSGNPQMDLLQNWDTAGGGQWDNIMQFANSYNGYNQLTSKIGESWNIVGTFEFALGDPMSNYYYETYTPSNVSVKNVAGNTSEVNIYPVPAQNMLHIDLNWNEAQAATITIYDVQGRVMRQWDAPNGTQYYSAVSVDNLATGTYFVKINGTQEQIVKQFVIAH